MLQPEVQRACEPRAHAGDGSAGTEPANDAQPCGDGLIQEACFATDDRLLVNGEPDLGRIAAERIAEEARRSDADDCEWMPFDEKRRSDNRGVTAVSGFPDVMAQNGDCV